MSHLLPAPATALTAMTEHTEYHSNTRLVVCVCLCVRVLPARVAGRALRSRGRMSERTKMKFCRALDKHRMGSCAAGSSRRAAEARTLKISEAALTGRVVVEAARTPSSTAVFSLVTLYFRHTVAAVAGHVNIEQRNRILREVGACMGRGHRCHTIVSEGNNIESDFLLWPPPPPLLLLLLLLLMMMMMMRIRMMLLLLVYM